MPIDYGTTLIVMTTDKGMVMVADNLVYRSQSGEAIPANQSVKKIFPCGNRMLIGSAQTLVLNTKQTVTVMPGMFKVISIEYKFEDWISRFISAQGNGTGKDPLTVANSLYDEARQTFKYVALLVKHGRWSDDRPQAAERIVSYVVAGYTQDFRKPLVYEIGVEINSKTDGVAFVPPRKSNGNCFILGEDEFVSKAIGQVEPFFSLHRKMVFDVKGTIDNLFPETAKNLQGICGYAVGLVRVESKFKPNKVGRSVNIGLIDTAARTCTLGELP